MPVTVRFAEVTPLSDPARYERCLCVLPEQRRVKADACRAEKDRLLSLGASLLLWELMQEQKIMPEQLGAGINGKPCFSGNTRTCFNLSHSGTLVMLAFSDSEIGCDVQERRSVRSAVLTHACSQTERTAVEQADGEAELCFCRIWARKESLLKCTGIGLNADLSKLPSVLEEYVPYLGNTYRITDIPIPSGYAAAVCTGEYAGDITSEVINFAEL